jgi:ATP-dependent Clp protease adaptor protein ClpS
MPNSQNQTGSRTSTKEPSMYNVIMHNDDVTTMDFVVHILRVVFFKSIEEATQLMLNVHQKESAVVGTYSYDLAVSKSQKAMQLANKEGFPLRLTVKETDDLPF